MAYKRKKQITFDLDTKLMNDEKINPSNIYNKLEKQLKEFNFSHVGGSVYKSDITLSQDDVNNIIGVIIINIPELSKYVKNFYVADIGIQYDLTNRFKAIYIQNNIMYEVKYKKDKIDYGKDIENLEKDDWYFEEKD